MVGSAAPEDIRPHISMPVGLNGLHRVARSILFDQRGAVGGERT